MFKTSKLLTASFIIMISAAGQASAHAHLTSSVPADKSIVQASPAAVALNFSEELNIRFSGATIAGTDGKRISTGDAKLSDDGKTLTVPLPESLDAGGYVVEWRVLSTDGHKTKGSYGFTVKP
ncbi:copper homeostasis periplasmic binding protein CopC [Rhizobium sp. AN80A]|uniref:copper homeostasis periplasmic binding protein CopC n=1 Tax=Rhizobium sp. AN80A TaxID=3040673 RepID=UPI0024B3A405|nr:copper homeostasis periplasmic binding protein CopC [Rhizobium sp. AN80A]